MSEYPTSMRCHMACTKALIIDENVVPTPELIKEHDFLVGKCINKCESTPLEKGQKLQIRGSDYQLSKSEKILIDKTVAHSTKSKWLEIYIVALIISIIILVISAVLFGLAKPDNTYRTFYKILLIIFSIFTALLAFTTIYLAMYAK
jgi:hypothetical protein